MATPQAYMSFTGINGIEGGNFLMERGVAPSAGEIVCVAQHIPTAIGTLEIRYSYDFATHIPPDYLLQAPYSVITRVAVEGRKLRLTFADFRYWWRFSHIDGEYNKPRGDGSKAFLEANRLSLKLENEKTLRELIELCLNALPLMSEFGFDTSVVDTTPRPHVTWKADRADLALEELLEQYGYVLVITLAGKIAIVPMGVGSALPVLGAEVTVAFSASVSALPSKVRIACSEVNYQCRFWLEAVGEDTDGTIKPIDDLSYKPPGGWSQMEFPKFPSVANEDDAELASGSVYRWYRVKWPSASEDQKARPDHFAPPGYLGDPELVNSVRQLFPLGATLNTTVPQSDGEGVEFDKAKVTGVFYDEDGLDANTKKGTKFNRGFSLDGERGIVKFSDYVYKLDAGKVSPADLLLLCTCQVTNKLLNKKEYYAFEFPTGGQFGVHTIEHEELVPRVTANYPGTSGAIPSVPTHNMEELQGAGEFHANAAATRMAPQDGYVAEYQGIRGIELDGLRRQVEWRVGNGQGSRTKASIGVEINSFEPTYDEYLEIQKRRLEAVRNRRAFRKIASQRTPQVPVQ